MRAPYRHIVILGLLALLALSIHVLLYESCADTARGNLDEVPNGNGLTTRWYTVTDDNVFPVRIDWHDYKQIGLETLNIPVSGGVVRGGAQSAGNETKSCENRYGYRHCLSQTISLTRYVIDTRIKRCKKKVYLRDLPKVSIVMTFTKEHISVLHRAIYSVKLRTPASLIADITLVHIPSPNDTISPGDQRRTEETLRHTHPDLVFVRGHPGSGIAQARMANSQRATGDILVFLQMPFEVNINWLPPLIEPIVTDRRVVTCPLLDTIDPETFQIKPGIPKQGNLTAVDWNFTTQRVLRTTHRNADEPYSTPVMEGKAFAINRAQFLELEGYDPGLKPYGVGEHLDLSFKVWLCGGEIIYTPCSKVGFITKKTTRIPYQLSADDIMNYKRIARVWLSDYAEFVLATKEDVEVGDIGEQIKLQERLACKPFRWYLEKVANCNPPLKPSNISGVVQCLYGKKLCAGVKNIHTNSITMKTCEHPNITHQVQMLTLTDDGHLTVPGACLAVNRYQQNVFEPCSSIAPSQIWIYDEVSKNIVHNETDRCLIGSKTEVVAFVDQCSDLKRLMLNHKWDVVGASQQFHTYKPIYVKRSTRNTNYQNASTKQQDRLF